MAGDDGKTARSLDAALDELEEAPYRFDFYQAMRLLESLYPDSPRYGHTVRLSDDPVRLAQEPSLRFAPASLSGFERGTGQEPHQLSVQFFGLCGPNGALPLHLTEHVRDRIRHHDDNAFKAFLDVFHHRMLSLFYRAWADAQPAVHFDRPETDRFHMYVGSLFGLGMSSLADRDDCPDLAKLYYAGRYACQTKHPEGLREMLSDFFGLPVQITEFVGQWTEIPYQSQFHLGERPESSTLGEACTLGSHVWDTQQKFRVTVGPVGWEDFVRLLPGGDSLRRLSSIVRNYVGHELLWDINLVLLKDETPSWELGEGKLGQTMWLDSSGVKRDSDDLLLYG